MKDKDADLDLDLILIRAKVGDKWGTFSLRTLLDSGEGNAVASWFLRKLTEEDYEYVGQPISKETALAMVVVLEGLGHVVYRVKRDLPAPNHKFGIFPWT